MCVCDLTDLTVRYYTILFVEGSLEVKLPTIWTDGKAEMGRVSEEKRRRKKIKKGDCLRRIKIQVREKVGKSRNTAYFQWFLVSLTFWLGHVLRATTASTFFDMSTSKSGPRMVRFVHFDLDTCFAPQRRALFRHLNFQKWSETGVLCSFWLGNVLRATTACNAISHLTSWLRTCTFGRSDVVSRGRRKGLRTLSKINGKKNVRILWHFQKGWQAWDFWRRSASISRGMRSTRDISIRHVSKGAIGGWFPERGSILEHPIFSFAKMILHDRCSTSYDLASLFRGRHSTLHRWRGKIAKRIWYEAVGSALNFPSLKEVSQNCFVFDVVNL